jgi:hypothetical protein
MTGYGTGAWAPLAVVAPDRSCSNQRGSITSEPRFQEKQYFGSGVGTEAAWLDRIGDPEVPSSRNHDRARNELCLFERSQKGCRLRVRVDNVITPASIRRLRSIVVTQILA